MAAVGGDMDPATLVLSQHWESRAQLTFSVDIQSNTLLIPVSFLTLRYSKDLRY